MARRSGRSVKARIRDVDRGYRKLLQRLGIKASKGRRSGSRSFKATKGSLAGAIKNALRGTGAKAANAWRVTVGIHEEQGTEQHGEEDASVTVAQVGSFNEFGLGVPERSFIRSWADENEGENRENLRKIGLAVVKGKISSPEQGLERFGLHAVGSVQTRMAAGIPPPNEPSTVAEKGSSTPLIDDGILRSSITHKVFKP